MEVEDKRGIGHVLGQVLPLVQLSARKQWRTHSPKSNRASAWLAPQRLRPVSKRVHEQIGHRPFPWRPRARHRSSARGRATQHFLQEPSRGWPGTGSTYERLPTHIDKGHAETSTTCGSVKV